ncbi:hypothetical protein CHUAL_008399 [Chamberlinius hualienensis]
MKFQRSNKLLSVAICLLAVVYSASSQCCDFYTTPCSWTGSWLNSPAYTPNTADYGSFWMTARSSYFKFIQDQSGTEVSDTTFFISGPGAEITINYFFDSPYTSSDNYFEVYFENVNTGFKTLVDARLTLSPNWRYGYTITCDSTVSFCCGAKDWPCVGRISVSANIDASYRKALFAFDSVGTPCSVSPPTTCCGFDTYTGNCAYTNWIWSTTLLPPILLPLSTGYIWTQIDGAEALFPTVTVRKNTDTFSFYYYIDSSAAEIQVAFYPAGGSPVPLTNLIRFSSTWMPISIDCSICCGGLSTCTGQLVLTAVETVSTVVAVDEVLFNGGCF